jgi:hypothetical protein
MKNTAINTLKYTGIVTLSQYIGSKKRQIARMHNEGGDALFRFLANCLAGDFAKAKLTMPTKVMLVELVDENDLAAGYQIPVNSVGFIHLLTKPEIVYDKQFSSVRYSCVIPKETVDSLSDLKTPYLGLYTDEATIQTPNEYAAICKLNLTRSNVASTALVIDWELAISNTGITE